jgi:hypothetical protein
VRAGQDSGVNHMSIHRPCRAKISRASVGLALAVVLISAACSGIGDGGGGGGDGGPQGKGSTGSAGQTWSHGSDSDAPNWTPSDGKEHPHRGANDGPDWLRIGPSSPNSDDGPDTQTIYDQIQSGDCAGAWMSISRMPESSRRPSEKDAWTVLDGLTQACLAFQGKGGSWASAEGAYSDLGDYNPVRCKDRAAYRLLGQVIGYHRDRPNGVLGTSGAAHGPSVCHWRIASVDAGGDAVAQPGDEVTVRIADAWFDQDELSAQSTMRIFVGDIRVEQILRSGQEGSLTTVVFALPTEGFGTSEETLTLTLTVGYSGTESLTAPLTVKPADSAPTGSGTPSVSDTPSEESSSPGPS